MLIQELAFENKALLKVKKDSTLKTVTNEMKLQTKLAAVTDSESCKEKWLRLDL